MTEPTKRDEANRNLVSERAHFQSVCDKGNARVAELERLYEAEQRHSVELMARINILLSVGDAR